MEIRVHFPRLEQDMKALEEKITKIHAEAIIDKINSLPISDEDRICLWKAIQRDLMERSKNHRKSNINNSTMKESNNGY